MTVVAYSRRCKGDPKKSRIEASPFARVWATAGPLPPVSVFAPPASKGKMISEIYFRVPPKVRRLFKNRATTLLQRYLLLRPALTRPTATSLTIELTDQCNLKCGYCPKSVGIGVAGQHIDFDLYKSIVDGAFAAAPRKEPIKHVSLVGFGEPLLYPKLVEAVTYLRAKARDVEIILTSNGLLISRDWGIRLAAAGVNRMTISVNATSREQYAEINRADLYEKVVANTKAFLAAVNEGDSGLRVHVQVLEGPNGPEEIEQFRREWQPYLGRCGEIQVSPYVNWAGQLDDGLIKLKKKNEAPKAAPARKRAYPCSQLMGNWIVTREGNALPCCMVLPAEKGDLNLGNVKVSSFQDLFQKGRILDLRRKNLNEGLGSVSPCNKCDAYLAKPNVWFRNPLHRFVGKQWY